MCKDMCKSGGACGGTHKKMKSLGLLALRIALGIIFIYMGYNKLGPGHEGTVKMMASIGFGGGVFMAYLVGLLEFVGGLMILLGVYASYAAMALSVVLLGALLTVHRGGPVKGYFLALSCLGGLLALAGAGAGCYRLVKKQCCCKECKDGAQSGCCGGGKCGPDGMKGGSQCDCKECCGGQCGCGKPNGACGCCKK